MKIRTGFVSNSSSSSFIISVKPDNTKCPHCGRGGKDFLDLIEDRKGYSDDSRVQTVGAEAVIQELSTDCDMDVYNPDDKASQKLVRKILAEEKNGNVVAWVDISYHDSELNDELRARESAKTVKIIEEL